MQLSFGISQLLPHENAVFCRKEKIVATCEVNMSVSGEVTSGVAKMQEPGCKQSHECDEPLAIKTGI